MWHAGAIQRRGLRGVSIALASLVAATFILTDQADARSRRSRAKAVKHVKVERYNPPYAAMVVDANTGAVLHSENGDSPRHPASLAKIMTLYLLFERMEAGKLSPQSDLPVSAHAAMQAPSKLALKPGESITVETAIRALVTKSANDVAVVVAEAVGGSEEEFARMMTRKARELGMKGTTYYNASGLPHDDQITTARDQVLLGRAVQERFPKYYRYFTTTSFVFRGRAMRNHNKLLGSVQGVDGIKTGYTNASGFNLVTSMKRGGRHVVAAVMGGRSGNSRDARMRELVGKYIKVASLEKTATVLAAAKTPLPPEKVAGEPMRIAPSVQLASTEPTAAIPAPAQATQSSGPLPGSTDPIKPNAVKTVKVKTTAMRALSVAPAAGVGQFAPNSTASVNVTTVNTVKSADQPQPASAKPGILGTLPAKALEAHNSVPADAKAPPKHVSSGYLIQVGAFPEEGEAKGRLATARSKASDVLGRADPFTEKVEKGDKTLYRARFAGFDRDAAEHACKALRRGEIPCMVLKN
jgi:D-alanyl-D-alanine carboxypeptidase